jgi:signal transduction histidine kinase
MSNVRQASSWLARAWRSGLLPSALWASPQPPVQGAGPRLPLRDVATALAGTVVVLVAAYGEAHPADPSRYFTDGHHLPHTPTAAFLLVLVAGLALVWRRRFPLQVLGVSTAAVVAFSLLGYVNGVSLLLPAAAMWALARVKPIRQSVAWAVALTVVLMAATAANNPLGPTGGGLILLPADVAVALFGGIAVSNRRAYVDSLRDGAEREARRQVDEERLRIARELHDVVAHTMATINVQASAAAQLLTDRPEQAAESLAAIRAASKDGLRELRAILNVLRHADEPADPTRPVPGLARLDALAAGVRAAGLPVTVTVAGHPRDLPAVTDLAAFRIIQEALTNAIRHAGQATAEVSLRYGESHLQIEVTDTGIGLPASIAEAAFASVVGSSMPGMNGSDGNGQGHGLRGMRERAAAAGGTIEIGSPPSGGFRVAARFPLDCASPVTPNPTASAIPSDSEGVSR